MIDTFNDNLFFLFIKICLKKKSYKKKFLYKKKKMNKVAAFL
jgi:hypothetical protein